MPQIGGLFLSSAVLCREDKVGYLLGGVGVEGGCDMAVDVEGDGDAAVAETFGDDFGVDAVSERQGGPGVAEVVRRHKKSTLR